MIRTVSRSICMLLMLAASLSAEVPEFLNSSNRIVFLGDSITHAGHYISLIETDLRIRSDQPIPELINLGLPSETACGLSESDHPFPRPNVHERLDRALEKLKPDVVVACYGMNDGIYHPFSENRFMAYQNGINLLIEKVQASGAKLVLMTPPPFDPLPVRAKGKLLPDGAEIYGYKTIYENYDDVLAQYADWIKEQSSRVEMVIDLHSPVTEYLIKQRMDDPNFIMSGDGVHLNQDGHQILARAILKAWGLEPNELEDDSLKKLVEQRQALLHNAYLSYVGHQRPGMKDGLPLDQALEQAQEIEQKINDRLVRIRPRLMSVADPAYHHVYFPASNKAGELSLEVDFYLWIPPGVETLNGIIVHQHGCGDGASKGGATAANDLHWQALARKWNCALMGSSYEARKGEECRVWCDARRGSADRFLQALGHFAETTGHREISSIPWCLWGHSGGGFWVSLMQTLYPERIVAIWLQSGTAYDRWISGEIPPVEPRPEVFQVPVVACPGFKEKTDERFHVAWDGSLNMFHAYRERGAPFIFAPDPRTSHECGDPRYLAIPFFEECLRLRLPKGPSHQPLKSIDVQQGYLANLDGTGVATFNQFSGEKNGAVWLPSEEFAAKWKKFIETGAVSDNTPPPQVTDVQITTDSSGQRILSWHTESDFESGIAGFRIECDGNLIAEIPEKPSPRFGRPLFQQMSYHDTPEQPLPMMQFELPKELNDQTALEVTCINSVGLVSEPVSVSLTAAQK